MDRLSRRRRCRCATTTMRRRSPRACLRPSTGHWSRPSAGSARGAWSSTGPGYALRTNAPICGHRSFRRRTCHSVIELYLGLPNWAIASAKLASSGTTILRSAVSRFSAMLGRLWSSRFRPRGILLLAFAASLLLHLAITQWDLRFSDSVEAMAPLTATLTELPPPPALVPAARPKPKPQRSVRVAAVPAPAVVAQDEPAVEQVVAAPEVAVPDPSPASAPLHESVDAATEFPLLPKQLPPRIDLAYRAFLGTRGFFIGDAVYRLEHSANQYKISTVAEARGLAAILFRGQGKATSEGAITASGLQPNTYSIERTNNYRRESATFDWETGMVTLNDDKALPLELPTFDPLAVLWQFYFAPPGQDDAEVHMG